MRRKVDYETVERDYVTSDASYRALSERYGVAFGAIAAKGRQKDANGKNWAQKRAEFRAKVATKTLDRDSTRYVAQVEELQFEMIQAARAVIFKVLDGMKKGEIVPQAKDMLLAIDKLQLLTGRPTERTEETVIGTAHTTIISDPTFLRSLEELTRGVSDGSAAAPRLRIEGSKPN